MLDRVRPILQQDCLLDPASPVVVGVSGGPDSLCLMDVMDRLGYRLVVAHLNHRLRPEAEADALAVQRIAETRQLPCALGEGDVPAYAETQALSIEEAARTLRYRFLFAQAQKLGAQAVAVAHTADDQIETVLMHLLRGAGLAGLRGMPYRALPTAWSDAIPLVRPLLATWREEVLAYCDERGLQPLLDRTNLDTTYFRNRLRHELLPTLESYNPGVRQTLWRMAQALAGDCAVLERLVGDAWEACRLEQGAGYVALRVEGVRAQPLAIQRHLLRRAIAVLRPGLRDVDFETVERGLELVTLLPPPRPSPLAKTATGEGESLPRTGQRDLCVGLRLVLEGERLWLAGWEADLPVADWPQAPPEPLLLDAPGEAALPAGWALRAGPVADVGAARQRALDNPDPFQAWVDPHGQQTPFNGRPHFHVRPRRPGDRFRPLGMGGQSVRLSDFMVNVKMPRRARAGWPLVCMGDEIVWVPGYRLAHPFRLSPDTWQVIHLQLERRR